MKRTPLYEQHKKLGAKMVPFAGWEMPLSYAGAIEEHRTVRTAVGLFDVSHMGRIELSGNGAADLLQRLATTPVKRLGVGGVQYALLLNEAGGILDDLMIYHRGRERYLVCANAVNTDKDYRWIQKQAAGFSVKVTDRSHELAQIAVQGPRSRELLQPLVEGDLDRLSPRRFLETWLAGVSMLLSRGGYAGELGYELYFAAEAAAEVWETILQKGESGEVRPCGLGVRDILRLEMAYPLYGNEIDEQVTPLEAGLFFALDFDKGDFIGRDALLAQREKGMTRRLVGFELLQPGVPRRGYRIFSGEKEIGSVTSGNHSPSRRKGIGMGYLLTAFAEIDGEILIEVRDKTIPAVIVQTPFYKKSGSSHNRVG